ncbi:hypothetical protein KKC65_03120 [Patescibacteria group bacterium]|nr:hypothetical protein [Patescibacteria group bacterium]
MKTILEKNKTHLVFPKDLLETIDETIGKRKRSSFVVEATKEKLAKENFSRVLEKTAGAWKNRKNDVNSYIRELRKSYIKRLERIHK